MEACCCLSQSCLTTRRDLSHQRVYSRRLWYACGWFLFFFIDGCFWKALEEWLVLQFTSMDEGEVQMFLWIIHTVVAYFFAPGLNRAWTDTLEEELFGIYSNSIGLNITVRCQIFMSLPVCGNLCDSLVSHVCLGEKQAARLLTRHGARP